MEYIKRIVDEKIKQKLKITGAIVLRGPKWCGKTTTAKQFAASILELQNPDMQENYIELAYTKPSLLLNGDKPRLIDEWQIAPKIWNAVKYSVDSSSLPGEYILTGSTTPVIDKTLHSGVGRFTFVNMKPLSLFESNESNGLISIKDILNGKVDIDGIKTDFTYEKIAYALARGGWPNSLKMEIKDALEVPKSYVDVLCEFDISNIDDVKRNPSLARMILKSYSRHISTIGSNKSLYNDIIANYSDVSEKTIVEYLNIFERLFIIEEIEAWSPNIRSKTSIRLSNKKSFVDPSIAVASLGITPEELIMDINTFGLLFENLVNRDLSIYLDTIDAKLAHYRDRMGLECDNIIHFRNGDYALIEVKLGVSKIEEAKEHLMKLEEIILCNEPKLGKPRFKMIITGTDMAYKTDNDILVVPIGCLRD